MDPLTIIACTIALAALTGLAWISGYEAGETRGIDNERASSNRRVSGLLAELNKYKPRVVTHKRTIRK